VPAAMEMLDRETIKAVEPALHVGYPLDAGAVLLIAKCVVFRKFDRWFATAYAILRHNGLPIGKRDFMGAY